MGPGQERQGPGGLVGFPDLDRLGEVGLEHGVPLLLELLHQLAGEAGTLLELVDHDPRHLQILVVVLPYLLHALEEGVQRPSREIVAVEGNQAPLPGDEGRQREEVERRRRVQVDLVVSLEAVEGVPQLVDLVLGLQLGLELLHGRGSRDQVEALERGLVDEGPHPLPEEPESQRLLEEAGHVRLGRERLVTEEVVAGVGLRIQVDHEHPPSPRGGHGGQVAHDGGFSDPALLVEDDPAHGTLRCGRTPGGRVPLHTIVVLPHCVNPSPHRGTLPDNPTVHPPPGGGEASSRELCRSPRASGRPGPLSMASGACPNRRIPPQPFEPATFRDIVETWTNRQHETSRSGPRTGFRSPPPRPTGR